MRLASQTVSRSISEPEVFHCRCAAADPLDLSAGQVAEPGVLLDGLDAQVERADEAPGDGQVRRGLQRRARRRGVQRVDQHETGPEVGGAPASQLAQVGKVAVVPRRPRPHGVQLGHEAPDRTVRHRRGQAEERRRDDHRAAGLGLAAGGLQLMPTQGQVGGQLERRLTDERTVDGAGMHVAVDLRELAPRRAVLGLHAHLHRRAVRDVHEDLPRGAGPRHDTGRHHQPPGRVLAGLQGRARLVLGARRHAERREHRGHRRARDPGVLAAPVPELGGHAMGGSQLGQRSAEVVGHARHPSPPRWSPTPAGRTLRQSRPTGPRRRPTGRAPTAGRTGRC